MATGSIPTRARYCSPTTVRPGFEERANLRPKTIRLYRYLLRCHIQPHFVSKTVPLCVGLDHRWFPAILPISLTSCFCGLLLLRFGF